MTNTQRKIWMQTTAFHKKVRPAFREDTTNETNKEPSKDPTAKTFTQEQVNTIIANENRKTQSKINLLQEQLTKYQQGGLSAEERKELEGQIEATRQSFLTKEQKAKEEKQRIEKESSEKIKSLEAETKKWKGLYTDTVIDNELRKAASNSEVKAQNPTIIVDLLKSKTTLEPVIGEDGRPTEALEPKVLFSALNEKGELTQLSISPAEAVKRMASDTANYGSLFGTFQKGGPQLGGPTRAPVIDSQESYMESRKSGSHLNIGRK